MTDVDVLVYGSTPAGVAAATHATGQVVLASPAKHVGGMMSGGLGWDDVNFEYRIGLPPPTTRVEPAVFGSRSAYARTAARVEAVTGRVCAAGAVEKPETDEHRASVVVTRPSIGWGFRRLIEVLVHRWRLPGLSSSSRGRENI